MNLVWINILIYSDVPELTKQISDDIWMSKSWSNEYQIICGCQRVDQTNNQIYEDGGKATHMNSNNIWRQFLKNNGLLNISRHYWNKSKQIKIIQKLPNLVKSGQHMIQLTMKWVQANIRISLNTQELTKQKSKYFWMTKNRPNKYLNIFSSRKSHKYNYKWYLWLKSSNIWIFKYSCSSLHCRVQSVRFKYNSTVGEGQVWGP